MTGVLTLAADGRVQQLEGKTREFKRDLSSSQPILRTLVAFANSAGGQLIVGVSDERSVVGVEDPLAEEERLTSLIADSISPQLVPVIDLVTLANKTLLVIEVPLSTRRPHYLRQAGLESGTYVRLGSTNRQADSVLVAELERTARGIAFEDLPAARATLADLDLARLSDMRGQDTEVKDLEALGLAVREGSTVVPTNAGVLVACPHPDRFLPSAWVQCGRIRGVNRTEIFDQTEIHTFIPFAVDGVMGFLTKHAFKSAEFGDVRRRDVYSIPLEPIREVVINALVHASYAERGTPIRIAFLDDRIEVESPGGLVTGMTIENMRRVSRLRNPMVARIFREMGLMEQWGTGVRRVFEELADEGLPEPQIEEIVDRLRFTIFIKHQRELMGGDKIESKVDEQVLGDVESPSHQVTKSSHQVESPSHQVRAILAAAAGEPASRGVLLNAVGISNDSRNVRRHILPLIEAGLLARTLPGRPTSPKQRYVTTDAGRALLARGEAS